MKLKRKEIIKRAYAHVEVLSKQISAHQKDRNDAIKIDDKCSASYYWGRISGLSDGINSIKTLIEYLEEDQQTDHTV